MIGPSTWGAGLAFLQGIHDMMGDLDKIQTPIHVFSSGDDAYVDSTTHSLVCDEINSEKPLLCSIEHFEQDWHELFNELNRNSYMEKAMSFFDIQIQQ